MEQLFHYYHFSLLAQTKESAQHYAQTILAMDENKVTATDLQKAMAMHPAKDILGIMVLNVSYLGMMTPEEFGVGFQEETPAAGE